MLDSRFKYTKYTQLGYACVNMLQISLDRTRKKYQKKVNKDKKLLFKVITRLLRNKKILKQAEKKARKKALYLATKLEEESKTILAENLNCPATFVGIKFSLII